MKTVRLVFEVPVTDLTVSDNFINIKFNYTGKLTGLKKDHVARLSWSKSKKAYQLIILKDDKAPATKADGKVDAQVAALM